MAANDLVLVTGASGFLAKHCIAELLKKGYRVRGSLRRPEAAAEVTAAVAKLVDPAGRLEFATLDLNTDAGWHEELRGCKYLLHIASPFPLGVPKNRDEIVKTARDGTLRALRAAANNGVLRTVKTSSTLAIMNGHPRGWKQVYTEDDWSDADSPTIQPYPLSKTLAERAAWEFAAQDTSGMELSVICPGFILGPALDRDIGTSAEVIRMFLSGAYPAVPRTCTAIADVRDVAAGHVAAMESPAAAGKRFICASESLWLKEIGAILLKRFPEFRRALPTRELPDLVVRLIALFDPTLRAVVPDLGEKKAVANEKARRALGLQLRTAEEAIVGMAQSLIDLRLVTPPARK
jgi:dihydroflavonol-4-reductase